MRCRKRRIFFPSLLLVFSFGFFLRYYTNHHNPVKRESSEVIVWAVLARRNVVALDKLLMSLYGARVIVLLESRSSEMEDVLRKHDTNFLVATTSCYSSKKATQICLNTNWVSLMKKAWDLEPDIVCFSTEEVVIHPYAEMFIEEYSGERFNGVQLSSKNFASPWCFKRPAWKDFQNEIEACCASAAHGWEETISRVQAYLRKKFVMAPLKDMSIDINKSLDGRETERTGEVTEFRVANHSKLHSLRIRLKTLSQATQSLILETWRQNASELCMDVCEEFQFEQSEDHRVYIGKPLQRGGNAFILDLGPTCVDRTKITVSKGGEEIEEVLGRKEEDEFPKYQPGAFQVRNKPKRYEDNSQKDILQSAVVSNQPITKYDVRGTTLAYTRYDYANVYHYNTDIFNIFITSKYFSAQSVLWLDGHASGNLDGIVPTLFDVNVKRIGDLSGTTCFERLVLAPRKYIIEGVKRFTDCNIEDYAQTMWKKYNIVPSSTKYDTIIVRDYYLAHPRVKKEVSRKFSESDLQNIKEVLPNAKFVRFQELSFKEQLQTIADTRTLYGIHGAGLTLGLFMEKGSRVVEWTHPTRKNNPFFLKLMSWRPDVKFERTSLQAWLNSMRSQTNDVPDT